MTTFLPSSNAGGVSTAINAVVASTSTATAHGGGPQVFLTIGAQPAFIRFGRADTTAVSSTNGLRLSANSEHIFSVPETATHVLHIRDGGTDSDISIQSGIFNT
jgi:hypothetical protein